MSKEFVVETFLFCENCLEDTMHQAKYKDNEIIELRCHECSNELILKKPVHVPRKKYGIGFFKRHLSQKS